MSTLKVDTIDTSNSSGNITVSRPLSGSGASLTNLPAANLTGTIHADRYTDTVYTHPTTAGNKHIPTAGATDQVLTYSSSGTASWAAPAGIASVAADTSPTLGGALDGADYTVSKINLKDYGEVTNALGDLGGGTDNIDLTAGNSVTATVSTGTETFTFSNPTATDELCGFTLMLTNGGSQTVNWPASVDWAGGSAPDLTSSGVDCLVFWTVDGGTIWNGGLVGADLS
jgi:hypothetical protein